MTITAYFIFFNFIIFFLWRWLPNSAPQFMINHFLVSWSGLLSGRIWTLITSVFSHILFLHLLMNMLTLASFGPVIESSLGRYRFLKFYLLAGVVASLSHALISNFLLIQPELPALGASGAISGVILLFSFLYPQQRILILGLIPIRAIFGAVIMVSLDFWGLFAQAEGETIPIGHGAHLGGALTGVIYYFLILNQKRNFTK